jgi:hypothetical protein
MSNVDNAVWRAYVEAFMVGWDAHWQNGPRHESIVLAHARADSLPLAICRAALAAVEAS